MWETLKEEQKYMERMADAYEDDGDTQMQELYENNADQLKASAAQVYLQIKNMSSASQERSYEKQVDTLTLSAQTIMNSYQQLAASINAQEKQVLAADAAYEETILRRSAGLATADEETEAKNTASSAKNTLASLKEEVAQLRENLLTMLGIDDSSSVSIGEIPEPDLTAIQAVSLENDMATAIQNDSAYVSELTSKVTGTDARTLRAKRVEEAAAEEEISLTAAYESLSVSLLEYEAAQQSFQAAARDYEALCQKKQAGLLSNAQWLQGEADYASAEAQKKTASMNLFQVYESYLWEVNGTV